MNGQYQATAFLIILDQKSLPGSEACSTRDFIHPFLSIPILPSSHPAAAFGCWQSLHQTRLASPPLAAGDLALSGARLMAGGDLIYRTSHCYIEHNIIYG